MATLIYSPGIRVLIETAGKNGIVDVSDDLQSFNLSLREESPSTFSFVLLNHRRKYDGLFTPNDIITVQMKRVKWMQVFSGYLDQVPYFSSYPRSVQMSATDTLKRLKYRPWDPGSEAAVNLMLETRGTRMDNDGGMRNVMVAMLKHVGKWNYRNIHIGRLPDQWSKNIEPLRQQVLADMSGESSPGKHGMSGASTNATVAEQQATGGSKRAVADDIAYPGVGGRRVSPRMETSGDTTNTAITGLLPVNDATASIYSGTRPMALSGEDPAAPKDPWYAQMQFPYSPDGVNAPAGVTPEDFKKAKAWWRGKPLLVTNPATLTSVVLRAADWGGPQDGIAMSEHALNTVLKAKPGDVLDVRFAPDTSLPGYTYGKGDLSSPVARTTTADGGGGGTEDPGSMKLPWVAADNLKANVNAARAFIYANWNVPQGIGGYRTGDEWAQDSHSEGLALDVMVSSGSKASGKAKTLGNSVALWFAQNPHVFDCSYVIWYDKIISEARQAEGWRDYGSHGGVTADHYDHVHLSFSNSGRTTAGSMGGGWSGANIFAGDVNTGAGLDPGGVETGDASGSMLNFNWTPHASVASAVLTGYRALMNDVSLLSSVDKIAKASMRSYMAAPNGDFIAWFPDYFGAYGTAATMTIQDLELAGDAFSIIWDDSRLVTHQYAVGSLTGVSNAPDDPMASAGDLYEMVSTQGIASVEFPELMEALFNVRRDDPRAKSWLNPDAILQRFGARPSVAPLGIIASPAMEFWYACRMFQKSWAAQFSSKVNLTFMPEVWPGMLLKLKSFGFQAYVTQVTHSGDFTGGMGGGFKTEVSLIAPSSTRGGGLYGLPVKPKSQGA